MKEEPIQKNEQIVSITRPDLAIDEEFTKQLIEEEQTRILYETVFYTLAIMLMTFMMW